MLRSQVIRLAHARSDLRKYLLPLLKEAKIFPTKDALKEYLHEHPKAKVENHSVGKSDSGGGAAKSKGPRKALFSAAEIENLPAKSSQKSSDPKEIFAQAEQAHEEQLTWLNKGKGLDSKIGAKVLRVDEGAPVDFTNLPAGPVVIIGPMKKMDRSKEKVEAEYGGDWSGLRDIVRASVAVDNIDQLDDVVAKLRESGMKLAQKPNDRFAKPTEAGYRDLAMSVEYPNGHVGELQLHVKSMITAKDKGHKHYEAVRSISAKAKKEGRDTLTEEEQKTVDDANSKMKKLYDDAWAEATGERTAALRGIRRFAVADKKYFNYNGTPAYIENLKFPNLVTQKGTQVFRDFESFFRESVMISPEDFEGMKDELEPAPKKAPKEPSKKGSLRSQVIRLAHAKPELRAHLLPLLKTAARLTFDTAAWRTSNGGEPKGRGSWAFSFGVKNPDSLSKDIFWTRSMTYTEAKKEATAEAKKRGFDGVVYVLS